jgi:hypothetical protein
MMKAKAMMKVLDELLLPTGLSVPKLTNINITTIISMLVSRFLVTLLIIPAMRIITITIQLTLPR